MCRPYWVESPLDNPCSEDATSSLGHSPETDPNADADEADDEEKFETSEQLDSVQLEKQEMDTENEFDNDKNGGTNQSCRQSLENGTEDSKSQLQGWYTEATQPEEQKVNQNNETSAHHYLQMTEKQEVVFDCVCLIFKCIIINDCVECLFLDDESQQSSIREGSIGNAACFS
ncbi:hypothetical protein BHE74_00014887 [Ensete ventricosum]|nr:hypothetical protein BHE74_00014887 [Ensete ventricosum]